MDNGTCSACPEEAFITSYIVSDLAPSQQVSFRVRARNDYGWGEWSSILIGQAAAARVPTTPLAPTVSDLTPSSLSLHWDVPDETPSVESYTVDLRVGGVLQQTFVLDHAV